VRKDVQASARMVEHASMAIANAEMDSMETTANSKVSPWYLIIDFQIKYHQGLPTT
jgi:hypothetical protein